MFILAVCNQESEYRVFLDALRRQAEVLATDHPAVAMQLLRERPVEVVIADEQLNGMSGIEFLQELVQVNPLINTAVVSSLLPEAFHEATEGLGVLMQLPPRPDSSHAEELFGTLARINQLLTAGEE